MDVREDIHQLLQDGNGIIRRRDHQGAIAQRLDRLRIGGDLVSVLPGVLALPETATDWTVRLAAGLAWLGPDAVVTRRSAARLTFWPECEIDAIEFCVPRTPPRARDGWSVAKGRVPSELTWRRNGVTASCPAYTAVDLADRKDAGDIIDRALRSRQATLEQMWQAFTAMPARPGNQARAAMLRDSRDKPWSELERLGHRLLRQRRISGWRTNVWVDVKGGRGYYVDVLFRSAKLVIEFDGWEFHGDRRAFEDDRRRRNELVLAGYTVLNFTWQQLTDDPGWVIECIKRALRG
jgi:very-short-patch-repair endonuclease